MEAAPTLAGQDALDAAPGVVAARIGAIAGLVPAVALGASRVILSESPEAAAQIAGNIAFTLTYAAPYLLALLASRAKNSGVRGGLLAAVGVLSLLASLLDLSLVTVVLLPATFVLWLAAAKSLAVSTRFLATALPAAIAGLLIAGIVGLGFFALFGVQDDEPQCWAVPDGSEEPLDRVSKPNTGRSVIAHTFCTSDTITDVEAAMGIGAVLVALLGMLFICHLRSPADGDVAGARPIPYVENA